MPDLYTFGGGKKTHFRAQISPEMYLWRGPLQSISLETLVSAMPQSLSGDRFRLLRAPGL